ncbi:MAG: penicillin acylase family protein, partial [Rhodobacteraceae bacterium]|nr:penicillin acylase family protein [Paracoccaceae bacterium]
MLSIFRWSLRAFLVLLFIFIISISTSYYLIIRSIPEFNAEYSLDGLKDRVEITRDRSSIPHIIGSNDNDIFFGLGFVHAQDRLWQMMLMRRTSQGKLSEIFGQKTVKTDILMRELGIHQSAKKSLQIQDSDTLSALVAYSNGINRWIETVNKKALGRGAPEFFLFKKKISPWVPEDSIAVLNLLSFQLSANIQEEIIRALASERLNIKEYTLLFGDSPPKELKLSMDHSRIKKGVKTTLNPLKNALQKNKDFQLNNKAMGGASNVFAIGPTRSVSKSTLLANDPHLSLTAPSIWYLARLGLKSGDAIGATIPGIPSILSGRTDKTAWGITSAYVDDQDIFLEKLNPLNNNQYETEFGSLDFELNETIIKVKDSPDVTVTIKKTRNGPILSGNQFNIRSVVPEGYLASLSWTALSTKNTSLQAAIRIMKAQDVKGIVNAGSEFYAPAQNLVAIDKTTIAIKTIGKIPKRTAEHTTNAKTPSEGWISQNRWNGYFSYASNPENISPKSGTVINTNNRLVNSKFPNHITYDYGDTQRVIRLKKLISKRPIHTKESLIEYQQDIVSVTAQNILPIVANSLWAKKAKTTNHKFSTLEAKGLDLLANWTGEMSKYQTEPLIYVAWMRSLQMNIVQDELGKLSNQFQKFNPD